MFLKQPKSDAKESTPSQMQRKTPWKYNLKYYIQQYLNNIILTLITLLNSPRESKRMTFSMRFK